MKRLLSVLLVSVLVFSVTATVYAADDTVTTDGGSKDISVNAKYVDGVSTQIGRAHV